MRRTIAALVASLLVSAGAAEQRSCETPEIWRYNSTVAAIYSVAQIVRDPEGTDVVGSATVIDRNRRLLITAAHLVDPDRPVYFRFPGIDTPVLRGKLVYRLGEADGDDEADGTSWGRARDIAVVRAEQPLPPGAKGLQLRTSIHLLEDVTYYGFPAGALTTSSGSGKAAVPRPPRRSITPDKAVCTRWIREMTIGGDSGSAILADGFLVGITSQSAAQGGAIFIPTGCFFDQLASTLPEDAESNRGTDLAYAALTTSTPDALAALLADDPNSSQIGNIDLYLASKRLVGEGKKILACPTLQIANERGLPLESFARIVQTDEQKVAVANALLGAAQGGGSPLSAPQKQQARLSVALFDQVIGAKVDNASGSSIAEARAQFTPDDARVLKSAADASLLAGSGKEVIALSAFAAKAAALAAVASDTPELRGASYATLGQASQAVNRPRLAAKAFTAARRQGFAPDWALAALKQSREKLGSARPIQPLAAHDLAAVISTKVSRPGSTGP